MFDTKIEKKSLMNKYERRFCKTCNDFQVFEYGECVCCDSEYVETDLETIEKHKILAQRKRYIESRFNGFILASGQLDIPNNYIFESDAGYISFRDIVKKERMNKLYRIWNHIVEDYKEIIERKQQRNDICSCGSGKKYKKCCLLEIDYLKEVLMMLKEMERDINSQIMEWM